jgi:CO/xanthine dehydrogenase FAD-binding subunit
MVAVDTFAEPRDLVAALGHNPGARVFGGGTLLLRAINEGDTTIARLLRSADPGFRRIRPAGMGVVIGAGVTMAEIVADASLAALHPAALAVGGPAVRNMATIGGNLFAPPPYGDFGVALLALDARVIVQSGFSAREMPIEDFYQRRDAEPLLVTGVAVRRPATPAALRWRKVTRVKPNGLAVLSIAALLPESGGRLSNVRVAYGAMAPTPVRAKAVERALDGKRLDAAAIEAAVRVAADGTAPATDAIASEWYRREVLPVHLRRLLTGKA